MIRNPFLSLTPGFVVYGENDTVEGLVILQLLLMGDDLLMN